MIGNPDWSKPGRVQRRLDNVDGSLQLLKRRKGRQAERKFVQWQSES